MSATKKIKQNVKRAPNKRDIDKLTYRQRMFVEHLLADKEFNTKRAAKNAGYKAPAMAARKCIENPVISRLIGREITKRAERLQVKADRVLIELARIGFSDPRQLFDENGDMLQMKDLPDDVARSIASFKVKTTHDKDGNPNTTVEVRFWNKVEALTLLAKHLGLLQEQVEVRHEVGNVLEEVLRRAEEQRGNIIDSRTIESKTLAIEGGIDAGSDGNGDGEGEDEGEADA